LRCIEFINGFATQKLTCWHALCEPFEYRGSEFTTIERNCGAHGRGKVLKSTLRVDAQLVRAGGTLTDTNPV